MRAEKEASMGSRYDAIVFSGTDTEAMMLYRSLKAKGLREAEEFVLLRSLNLNIPERLECFSFIEDKDYERVLNAVLS